MIDLTFIGYAERLERILIRRGIITRKDIDDDVDPAI